MKITGLDKIQPDIMDRVMHEIGNKWRLEGELKKTIKANSTYAPKRFTVESVEVIGTRHSVRDGEITGFLVTTAHAAVSKYAPNRTAFKVFFYEGGDRTAYYESETYAR
jgi:hypothetical protein